MTTNSGPVIKPNRHLINRVFYIIKSSDYFMGLPSKRIIERNLSAA